MIVKIKILFLLCNSSESLFSCYRFWYSYSLYKINSQHVKSLESWSLQTFFKFSQTQKWTLCVKVHKTFNKLMSLSNGSSCGMLFNHFLFLLGFTLQLNDHYVRLNEKYKYNEVITKVSWIIIILQWIALSFKWDIRRVDLFISNHLILYFYLN